LFRKREQVEIREAKGRKKRFLTFVLYFTQPPLGFLGGRVKEEALKRTQPKERKTIMTIKSILESVHLKIERRAA